MRRSAVVAAIAVLVAFLLVSWIVSRARDIPEAAPPSQTRFDSPSPGKASAVASPALSAGEDASPSDHQQADFVAAFAKQIDFYGRVVDQTDAPVVDAEVRLSANDKPFGGHPSEYKRKTDPDGCFSIEGISGLTLAVEVSKVGYRVIPPSDGTVTSSGVFEYGLSSIRGPHHAEKNKPVIFKLLRRGEPQSLIKVGEKEYRVPRDGTPVTMSLDKGAAHRVVVHCWNTDNARPVGQRQYDWRLEIVVVDGGLAARTGSFDFVAPEGGYTAGETIEMLASLPPERWSGIVERSYFIRFADNTFARVRAEMHAGGDHFLVWESFYNSSPGNRNLEGD